MELSWLEDLVALSRCSSFSRAAETRNITQPAFSRRIRALENWVGEPLVDRSTHKITLTGAGEVMLALAGAILPALEAGRREARDAMSARPALHFASTHALSLTVFPRILKAWESIAVDAPIHLYADTMVACEKRLAEGTVQFLLCHHHQAAPTKLSHSDFSWTVIGSDRLIPVCGRDKTGRAIFGLSTTPQPNPTPLLSFDGDSGMGRIIQASRTNIMAGMKTIFTSHLAAALKAMAIGGKGVAWLPLSVVEDELGETGNLAQLGDGAFDIPVDVVLLRSNKHLVPQIEALWQAFQHPGA